MTRMPIRGCGFCLFTVKAGGMRVAQHKPSKPEEKPAPAAAEEGDEEQAVAAKEKPASVMIAGFESQVLMLMLVDVVDLLLINAI